MICFANVTDVTEIHHGTEPLESINESNDVDAEVNKPATNEALHREISTPNSFKVIFYVS